MLCFFQAEDGIRYLVRSRGLGDVYKRQAQGLHQKALQTRFNGDHVEFAGGAVDLLHDGGRPVSYTHLTLPTSDLV